MTTLNQTLQQIKQERKSSSNEENIFYIIKMSNTALLTEFSLSKIWKTIIFKEIIHPKSIFIVSRAQLQARPSSLLHVHTFRSTQFKHVTLGKLIWQTSPTYLLEVPHLAVLCLGSTTTCSVCAPKWTVLQGCFLSVTGYYSGSRDDM